LVSGTIRASWRKSKKRISELIFCRTQQYQGRPDYSLATNERKTSLGVVLPGILAGIIGIAAGLRFSGGND